jgi:hypothetical protein
MFLGMLLIKKRMCNNHIISEEYPQCVSISCGLSLSLSLSLSHTHTHTHTHTTSATAMVEGLAPKVLSWQLDLKIFDTSCIMVSWPAWP